MLAVALRRSLSLQLSLQARVRSIIMSVRAGDGVLDSSVGFERSEPRQSASLILINPQNQVLLVQRNPTARSFGNFHVFPGGNFDKTQDISHKFTAIRETFEETGILLASSSFGKLDIANTVLDESRKDIHSGRTTFPSFLRENRLVIDLSLLPFTQWVTPISSPRRYHTHFFLAFLDESRTLHSDSEPEQRLPTTDGGLEVIATSFRHPSEAIASFKRGDIFLMPPQYYILVTLEEILKGGESIAEQRARICALSHGSFGRSVFRPVQTDHPGSSGYSFLVYEGDELRGGPVGRRHRARVRWGKKGIVQEIELERNFDIWTEFPTENGLGSKL